MYFTKEKSGKCVYKYSGLAILSYVTLDDEHKTVSFGKVTNTYSGGMGNISDISVTSVTVTPLNAPEQRITHYL